ncbi:MAG: hypothetical protein RR595_02640 [Lysinibacillus sp.]
MTQSMQTQDIANRFIEKVCVHLTKKLDVEKLEQQFKETIDTKRQSASSKTQFFDTLMLNMLYFTENEQQWQKEFHRMLDSKSWMTQAQLEEELLMHQMRIRQQVAEQMDSMKEVFHQQYNKENMTEENIVYDYAYSAAAHSLRIDFLTVLVATPQQSQLLFQADLTETMRIANGYIAYHVDALINKMQLV